MLGDLKRPMASLDLIVIVLNYQNAAVTKSCIASILPSLNDRMKLLLVDNGSQDGSLEDINSAFPEIQVLALPVNLGFAGGFNAGIELSLEEGAAKILLANNDTVFERDTIAVMLNTALDIAVPKILFFDHPDVIWCAGAQWRRFPPGIIMRGYKERDGDKYNHPVPLEYATGCVLMARRQVFECIGGFDPDYGNYMEDYDFFFRVRKAGFTVGYVPAAVILHRVSQTLGIYSKKQYEYLGRNSVLFYRLRMKLSLPLLLLHLLWVLFRELLFGRFKLVLSFLQGMKDGFEYIRHKEKLD
jgi:GT2 family glycosyltransferase